ncbi:MAG: glycosyltransferase family 39 protein [Deltaproteobacteria bacterium]|nr:glycosyltransferase family 39 protein [Deltaproteobacteria bacterium]
MITRFLTDKERILLNPDLPSFWRRYWEWIALALILLLGAVLRLWRLDQNGYGTEYYAAGVRSMMDSWHNFLYMSFDSAGFVSIDKPPLALWAQVVSAKLFGFHGLSLLLPQVLEGVAAIGLVYYLVRRHFGSAAGLLAGLFLALTPVCVAIDRSNNTDSCLILVLILAAWGMTRAAEEGRRTFLFLSMALIGIGFNVKMMAAFVVLPIFVVVYLLGAPIKLKRRIVDLTISGFILALVSLSWTLFYDLTPPDKRPYVGSTRGNSMIELTMGHNAMGRFIRPDRQARPSKMDSTSNPSATAGDQDNIDSGSSIASRDNERWSKIFVRVPVGPLRLTDRHLAGQMGWLLPLAIIGWFVAAFQTRFQSPLPPGQLSLILWAGWALTYGIVYSLAGGIFHFYYLATLGPPLAALAGIGVVGLWDWYLKNEWGSILLPVTLLLTAAWQVYIQWPFLGWNFDASGQILTNLFPAGEDQSGDWLTWLSLILLGGTLVSTGGLLIPLLRNPLRPGAPSLTGLLLGLGLLALLMTPAAWSLSSVLARDVIMLPSADLNRLVAVKSPSDSRSQDRAERIGRFRKLVTFLKSHHRGERFLLASSSSRLAAPIIVRTGEAVMAMGGFMGRDPILTPDKLAQRVKDKQLRFVMLGDFSIAGRRMGAEAAGKPIADWVRENGKPVDPSLWRSINPMGETGAPNPMALAQDPKALRPSISRASPLELYDLRPEADLAPASSR